MFSISLGRSGSSRERRGRGVGSVAAPTARLSLELCGGWFQRDPKSRISATRALLRGRAGQVCGGAGRPHRSRSSCCHACFFRAAVRPRPRGLPRPKPATSRAAATGGETIVPRAARAATRDAGSQGYIRGPVSAIRSRIGMPLWAMRPRPRARSCSLRRPFEMAFASHPARVVARADAASAAVAAREPRRSSADPSTPTRWRR